MPVSTAVEPIVSVPNVTDEGEPACENKKGMKAETVFVSEVLLTELSSGTYNSKERGTLHLKKLIELRRCHTC